MMSNLDQDANGSSSMENSTDSNSVANEVNPLAADEGVQTPDVTEEHLNAVFAAIEAAIPAPELGELMPKGRYIAEARDVTFNTSPEKKTPSLDVRFQIRDGRFRNRCAWFSIFYTFNNVENAKRDLAKLGLDHGVKEYRSFASGMVFELTVVIETGADGKRRNAVQCFVPLAGETVG